MWVLRAYGSDDELRSEQELAGFDPSAVLGFSPTKFGSTPLDRKAVMKIAESHGLVVPKDKSLEFFLDFDADPREPARRRRSTFRFVFGALSIL